MVLLRFKGPSRNELISHHLDRYVSLTNYEVGRYVGFWNDELIRVRTDQENQEIGGKLPGNQEKFLEFEYEP